MNIEMKFYFKMKLFYRKKTIDLESKSIIYDIFIGA